MKNLLLLGGGFFFGLYVCWPGIIKTENWTCVKEITLDSMKSKTPIRAALSTPPKYFLNSPSYKGSLGKVRILGDTCFR